MDNTLYEDQYSLNFESLIAREADIEYSVQKLATQEMTNMKFVECIHNYPQSIFIINVHGIQIVGRKLTSDLYKSGKINYPHCSIIKVDMLLGKLTAFEKTDKFITVFFSSFTQEDKLEWFSKVLNSQESEIVYPFRYIEENTGLEKESPADGWKLNINKAKYLGHGEEHIRTYAKSYFSKYHHANDGYAVLMYDPACSTGQFLSETRIAVKNSIVIGQDLSQQMVDYARSYLDICSVGDARVPCVKNDVIDILILRFLNSEVVNEKSAKDLFIRLVQTLKTGGLCVCFGHTPVLLNSTFMEKQGMRVMQSIAISDDRKSIFQFYCLEKNSHEN